MTKDDSKTRTVFFVDDSATDRVRGTGLIRKSHSDWNVVALSSAENALKELEQTVPDILVTDLVMPEMDGKQLLRIVRDNYPTVPVVLITAQGDDRIAAECVGMGAVNYVPKRLLADQLVSVLDEVIQAEDEVALTRRVLKFIRRNQCRFEINSDLDQIRSLVNFFRERLHATHLFSAARVQQITMAVREALLNAHFHGNFEANGTPLELNRDDYIALASNRKEDERYQNRRIRVAMSLQPDRIEFSVEDDGPGFEQSCLADLTGLPDEKSGNGNGVRQMNSSMDSVSWNAEGNAVTLSAAVEQPSD